MIRVALLVLVLCGCPSKPTTGPSNGSNTTGNGSGPTTATNAKTCDDVKPRVEQLYRVEAQAKEPKRIEEAVADNTTMVMRDCARDPATFVPCLASVPSIAELEKKCLVPLDDEGTEGDQR